MWTKYDAAGLPVLGRPGYQYLKSVYVLSGTTTYTISAGVRMIRVQCLGAGAAGGGVIDAATNSAAGGGGGGPPRGGGGGGGGGGPTRGSTSSARRPPPTPWPSAREGRA